MSKLTLKQKVALYEEFLNNQAEWDLPEERIGLADEPGSVMSAREVLHKAGVTPEKG